jgi:hypothetical protein
MTYIPLPVDADGDVKVNVQNTDAEAVPVSDAGSSLTVDGSLTNVGTVSTVTEVTNVSSVDLVDAITEVSNITSVDKVDYISNLGSITSSVTVDAPASAPLYTNDWYVEVAKGNIPGHSIVHKYGKNPDIPNAATFESVWNGGGDYTGHNATAAETLEVFSSSVNDVGTLLSSGTATGGSSTTIVDTGATFVSDGVTVGDVAINDTKLAHGIVSAVTETTITVYQIRESVLTVAVSTGAGDSYRIVTQGSTGAPVCRLAFMLDANYDETSEYIILNGTTPVDTVGTYYRQSRAKITGGTNAGEITSRQKTTTANVMMVMPIGYNTTMIAAYTIPNGKRGYIINWFAGLAGKVSANVEVRFKRADRGDSFQVMEELSAVGGGSSFVERSYRVPKNSLAPGSDLQIDASSDTNSTVVVAGFDLLLIDDGF